MNDLEMLMQLQNTEDKIVHCNKILKDGSYIYLLKKMKTEFEEFKGKYIQEDKKLKELNKEYTKVRYGIKDETKIIDALKDKLYNKLGSDINLINCTMKKLEKHNANLYSLENKRDELLRVEEKLKSEKEEYRVKLFNTKENFYSYKEKCNSLIIKAQEELKEAEIIKTELENNISDNYLKIYNKIRANKKVAVAELQGNICSECRMRVSAITVDKINNSEKIITCDNCGRILYYKNSYKLPEAK